MAEPPPAAGRQVSPECAPDSNPLYDSAAPKAETGSVTASTAKGTKSTKATLHAKLGGPAAVAAAVDLFYKKVLGDEDLRPFFANVDMVTLVAKQNRFLAYAFGATSHYSGKDIVMAHAHLVLNKGLNLDHFDKVAGHFVETLKALSISEELVNEAATVLMGVRPLFDPAKYKGNINVDKIEKAAAPSGNKGSGQTPSHPACGPECCSIQ